MKRAKYSILVTLALLLCLTTTAQTDSRQRTAETVVADGLAQLPAQTSKTYNQVISELAGTGQQGVEMIAAMLKPADKNKNATFEYALDGICSYVSAPGKERMADAVRKGLINSLNKCTDNPNKAFLMTQLQKLATPNEAAIFEQYLKDDYLKGYAVRALATTPGINDRIVEMVKAGTAAPKADLAYLAYFKKLKGVEPTLLGWLKGADDATKTAVYNALTVCGSNASVQPLLAAAKANNFALENTGATDSYLQLLQNLVDSKTVLKQAKALAKSDKPAVRCTALELILKSDSKNATKNVLAALKDKDIQYRNTALDYAKQYAGEGIFASVAKQMKSLSPEAQIDVVRWLGNNHAAAESSVVFGAFKSNNKELVEAAIQSASKIGGNEALTALVAQLNGPYAAQANTALLSFNGNISEGVLAALNSSNTATQAQALKLASSRRISSAYDKVVSLTNSSDATLKQAAFEALKGVARVQNFGQLCSMMEKSSNTAEATQLQAAAKSAIQAQSADEQFVMINSQLKSSSKPALYYPLLAQAGNSNAIAKLQEEYKKAGSKDAAFKSLLQVNNPEMIDVLYTLAQENASSKDAVLSRYLTLAKASENTEINKYLLYRRALELNPSDKVKKSFISALSQSRTLPSLRLASSYLDNDALSYAAATSVKNIVAKTPELQQGNDVKNAMQKALNIFKAEKAKGNADAGYAVDEISGILPNITAGGYAQVLAQGEAAPQKPVALEKKYENFEMYLDWMSNDAKAVLNLRSMPLIALSNDAVAMTIDQAKKATTNGKGNWNTLYVKVINDRIFVTSNGTKLVENMTMKNTPETKAINATGLVQLIAEQGAVSVRNININELPTTPVYTLTKEEQKAGFEVLFDGRSLEKWQGNKSAYVPVDGNIYVTANYGGEGNLYTNKKYSDFIYRFEFCFATPGVNNGIGIRTNIGADAAYDGMEIQVLDHDDPIYAGLQPYQQHGSVYGIIVPKHVKFGPLGTWNTEEIQMIGDKIKVTVNGEVITEGNIREACKGHNVAPDGAKTNPYTVDHKNHPGLFNKEGYVSFCGHGAGVKFRNVRILDLSKKNKKK